MIYISFLLASCKYKYFCLNMKLNRINFYFSALKISELPVEGGEDNEIRRNYSRMV
jgi:hypothetical protein